MTPQIVTVVNNVFSTTMVSARVDGPPVEVYTINMWQAGGLLQRLLAEVAPNETCILTPRKEKQRPTQSHSELPQSAWISPLHPCIDGQGVRIKHNKTTVSTWHGSKGTEHRCCVIFGFTSDVKFNPAYVALTRCFERLIVLQDESMPHPQLLRCVRDNQHAKPLRTDNKAFELASTVKDSDVAVEQAFTNKSALIQLDEWRHLEAAGGCAIC